MLLVLLWDLLGERVLAGPLLPEPGEEPPLDGDGRGHAFPRLPSARAVLGLKEMLLSILCHALICPESGICRNSFV